MAKRLADCGSPSGSQPPAKKVHFESVRLGDVSSLPDMDMNVIAFQNKKLAQRLQQRHRTEEELRQKIEQLEKRHTQDAAILNVVFRYWNQLDEDFRVLLQRFDVETVDESEDSSENVATRSFLNQQLTWDEEEVDEKLANRVEVSKGPVAKVIQAFHRLMQRNRKVTLALRRELDGRWVTPLPYSDHDYGASNLEETIGRACIEIQPENANLHTLNTTLQKKYLTISLKVAKLQESFDAKEKENAELGVRNEDLEDERVKMLSQTDELENNKAIGNLKTCQQIQGNENGFVNPVVSTRISEKNVGDLQKEIEERREFSNNRLKGLDKLNDRSSEFFKEIEKLEKDVSNLPESVIETTEYKRLHSQLDETRKQLQDSRDAHFGSTEMMVCEESEETKKLETEVKQLREVRAQLRIKNVRLEIDYLRLLAANDQTNSISREIRLLINSIEKVNQQSTTKERKADAARRKIGQLEEQVSQLQKQIANQKLYEETLMNEMEGTGIAYDEMRDQNKRLILKLKEKDEAYSNFMAEIINAEQSAFADALNEQVELAHTQVETANKRIMELEDKVRKLRNSKVTAKKKMALLKEAMEEEKRKAVESAQFAADLKSELEAKLKEVERNLMEKADARKADVCKTKGLEEDIAPSRRKEERSNRKKSGGEVDEILKEEIRQYKEKLVCPACKQKPKDAVITKCFHVFCWDCIRTCYELRHRKCPQCNTPFGAKDYHKLYFST